MKLKLITLFFISFITVAANAAEKLAFLNSAVLLEKSPQAIKATNLLKEEFKDREAKLRELVLEIQEKEKSYKNDSAIMSEEQRKKAEEAIIQSKRQFQFDKQSIGEDLQKRRNQLLQGIQKEISAVIRTYGQAQGYDFIFSDGVAFASSAVNITDEILKELEKQ